MDAAQRWPIRERLPGGGVLRIERPLPFLLVHRAPPDAPADPTTRLIRGEAAYLAWRGAADDEAVIALAKEAAAAGSARYGAFLVLEVWSDRSGDPAFRIRGGGDRAATGLAAELAEALIRLREIHAPLAAVVEPDAEPYPPGMPPLLTAEECYPLGALRIGVQVPAVFLQGGDVARTYPVFFRTFRARFAHALRRAVFEFVRLQTDEHLENFRMLGPRTVDEAVWRADRAIDDVARSFDYLLLVSPIDEDRAREAFLAGHAERTPRFQYRLLPVDPDRIKRRLFEIDLDVVEDASLGYLLRDKRDELDMQASMLAERGSRRFLYDSLRMYGPVTDELLGTAHEILDRVRVDGSGPRTASVDAARFHARALEELRHYRAGHPAFDRGAEVRSDVTGLIVSRGNLLIGERIRLDAERVEALVHHEIGTHVVTYVNGEAQPLRLLASGLAAYDELQEGLGILGEFLAGGLTPHRARILAARVVAARAVERGADFIEVFRLLTREFGFSDGAAFETTARVHHGGGLTRDLIYLRGFVRLVDHLRAGGELEPLYIGKIALKHVPIVRELRDRGILHEPPLRPRQLELEAAGRRLDALLRDTPLPALLGAGPQ